MNFKNEYTVIILSAGQIPESILPFANSTTHSMIPINGKPAIYWSLKKLLEIGFKKFMIVTRTNNSNLKNFVTTTFGKLATIRFITIDKDLGPGYSLGLTIKKVKTSQALIVLGDTLFEFGEKEEKSLKENASFVLYKPVQETYRWSLIETDKQGSVNKFIEKPLKYTKRAKALIGVYKISNLPLLVQSFNNALKVNQNFKLSQRQRNSKKIEITHVLSYYIKDCPIQAFEAKEWFDVGHIDNLLNTKRSFIQNRAFNQIIIEDLRGVIIKKSSDSKFLDEIAYYHRLPQQLKPFFPHIISSDTAKIPATLEMEYYGYPTLSELFVFGNLNLSIWERILKRIYEIIQYFNTISQGQIKKIDFKKIYIDKTTREFEALENQSSDFKKLLTRETIKINNKYYYNFKTLWNPILKLINLMTANIPSNAIHGDMHFGNILYDINTGIVKFVDPRGNFGKRGIYGDTRYDIAKISHSIRGSYDFIIHDLYQLNENHGDFEFEILRSKQNRAIIRLFQSTFFQKFEKKEILLIEGLLFISMCARHYEDKNRQTAFYLTGIKLLNEIIAGN